MTGGRVMRRRLDRIGTMLPDPKPPAPPLNLAALTEAEVAEVEALAARCTRDPHGRRFGDRWNLDALSDAELGRLEVLLRKAHGHPQSHKDRRPVASALPFAFWPLAFRSSLLNAVPGHTVDNHPPRWFVGGSAIAGLRGRQFGAPWTSGRSCGC